MAIDWQHDKVFRTELSPKPEEIDGLGHTNNAAYIRWCEQIAWQHSNTLGISLDDYQQLDRAMAIVHAEYDYLAASYQDDSLELATCLSDSDGRMKLTRHFQLIRKGDGAVVFRGLWQFRCIQISSGRPKRMPPSFIGSYGDACIDNA